MTSSIDPFDDALEDLRISGSVLLHEAYSPPWAISVPDEVRLRELLSVGSEVRVFPFHLARRRGFNLEARGLVPVRIETPEVVLCLGGDAHRLSGGRGAKVTRLDAILSGKGIPPAHADDASATELVCGVFTARASPLNPMLGALPPFVTVSTGDAATSPTLAAAVGLLVHELDRGTGGSFTIARLLEILCAESLRTLQREDGAPGWFRGLRDPQIGEALRCVHADPAHDWTVEELAKRIALSPSRFAARFRASTGESVMRYVGRWRANVACRLLRDTNLPLSQIAGRVGYESFPAFSRAFKSQLGSPPAAWRAALRSRETRQGD